MKLLFTDLCSVRTMNYEKGLFKIASRGWPDSHSLFLLRQENVSKRRRPQFAALRVPICASQKMGKLRNSLRSNNEAFSSIFCPAQMAAPQADEVQQQHQKQLRLVCLILIRNYYTASDKEEKLKSRNFIAGTTIFPASPNTCVLPNSSILLSMLTGLSLKRKFLIGYLILPFSI